MIHQGPPDAYERRSYQLVRPAKSGPLVSNVVKLSYVSMGTDYLVCNPYSSDGLSVNPDATVYVMKPWTLRRTPWDGQVDQNGVSYAYTSNSERLAVSGATSETQKITPDYQLGDVILAVAGTETFTVLVEPENKRTRLIDLNVDGRAWAHLAG